MEALTAAELDILERDWREAKNLDWLDADSFARLLAMARSDRWVPVGERMPESGAVVLACYRNSFGKLRRIRACWVAAKTSEGDAELDFCEYDEATDTYYIPEGWYEQIDNWPDYTAVAVCEGPITHWAPLPQPPKD